MCIYCVCVLYLCLSSSDPLHLFSHLWIRCGHTHAHAHMHTCTQTIHHLPKTPDLLSLWSKVKEMQQVNWSLRGQQHLISLFLHPRAERLRQKKAGVLFCLWQQWYRHFLESYMTGLISLELHLTLFPLTPVTSCFPTGSSPIGSPRTCCHTKYTCHCYSYLSKTTHWQYVYVCACLNICEAFQRVNMCRRDSKGNSDLSVCLFEICADVIV